MARLPGRATRNECITLYGGARANTHFHSGLRIRAGLWLDGEKLRGIEADYFFLGDSTDRFVAGSPGGTAILARPFVSATTGLPAAGLVSFPELIAGAVGVEATSEFHG